MTYRERIKETLNAKDPSRFLHADGEAAWNSWGRTDDRPRHALGHVTRQREKVLGKDQKAPYGGLVNMSPDYRGTASHGDWSASQQALTIIKSKIKQVRYCGEHFALAMALIEDAMDVLVREADGKSPRPRGELYRGEDKRQTWRETVYWLIYEIDPDGSRVCSLNWCVNAINAAVGTNIHPDSFREQAVRLGLIPREGYGSV